MSPALLRLLWKAIDESSSSTLLGSTEQDLTHQLLLRVRQSRMHLTAEEIEAVRHYIHVRSPLIEDVVRNQRSLFVAPMQARETSLL